jgi:hypothetical protein
VVLREEDKTTTMLRLTTISNSSIRNTISQMQPPGRTNCKKDAAAVAEKAPPAKILKCRNE